MPFLSNDRLDPARSHGDVLISIEADHEDTVQYALRQMMRATRRYLLLSWTLGGYSRGVGPVESETPRNLMGFKDGTANLDLSDADLMDRQVWVGPDDDEPAWAVGGPYHVVRVIRMLVEFWDRTRLGEQEAIIGRHKVSGAPLGSEDEFGGIFFADDPDGVRTPLDAHIRLANPRTPDTEDDRLPRRGFSFARGVDAVGQPTRASLRLLPAAAPAVPRRPVRLNGEPLEEYILPVGGGFFFALPGPKDERTLLGRGPAFLTVDRHTARGARGCHRSADRATPTPLSLMPVRSSRTSCLYGDLGTEEEPCPTCITNCIAAASITIGPRAKALLRAA